MPGMELRVDPEFQALCQDLTPEEANLLEASLEKDGCRDPIIVWANHDDTILDGHNRYRICLRFDIPFKTRALKIETRGDAVNWIIANQLGRRNLTDQQKAYLRGKRYKAEKKEHGGQVPGSIPQNEESITTSERLATEYQVSRATIERDADFAEAVDTLAESAGPKAKSDILSGRTGATKKDVIALASLPKAEQQKAIAGGKPAIKAAVKEATESKKPDWAKGPSPQEEARNDPEVRWLAGLHKLWVLLNSTRDNGGIQKLTAKWTAEGRRNYLAKLKHMVTELGKWIKVLENG